MARIIDLFSPTGKISCDAFLDKMTLTLAAVGCGRRCISIERGILCLNIALASLCRNFLSIDGSKHFGKSSVDIELGETISPFYDRDAFANENSALWELLGSENDDEEEQNEEGINEKNETLRNLGHDVSPMFISWNAGGDDSGSSSCQEKAGKGAFKQRRSKKGFWEESSFLYRPDYNTAGSSENYH